MPAVAAVGIWIMPSRPGPPPNPSGPDLSDVATPGCGRAVNRAPLSDAVKLPREHVHGLAFTQGGELIASAGGMEDIIRLWDLRIAAREPPLEGHRGIVTDLAATGDATPQ